MSITVKIKVKNLETKKEICTHILKCTCVYIRYTFPKVSRNKVSPFNSKFITLDVFINQEKKNYCTDLSLKSTSYSFYLAHVYKFFKHIIKENSRSLLRPMFSLQ